MANYLVLETCACGASIKTEAYNHDTLRPVLTEWRNEHRHIAAADLEAIVRKAVAADV